MVRIIRSPDGGVSLDPTGKRSGRGAYVCLRPECLERALQGKTLAGALKTEISAQAVESLRRDLQARIAGDG